MQKDHGIGPGAISPYAYYNSEVKPLYSELESTKGTLNYFIKWSELFPKIESKRKRYIPFLPPILIGTAILKVASDYYESLGYDVDDVEGSEIACMHAFAIKDCARIHAYVSSRTVTPSG